MYYDTTTIIHLLSCGKHANSAENKTVTREDKSYYTTLSRFKICSAKRCSNPAFGQATAIRKTSAVAHRLPFFKNIH